MKSFPLDIPKDWQTVIQPQLTEAYLSELSQKVALVYKNELVYPAQADIFNALKLCPFTETSIVILGQDPYHGANQAHGLAFSVTDGVPVPPSLRNIYRERLADVGIAESSSGDLTAWATQGVLLLNTTLTVRAGEAGSHHTLGWEQFTDAIIQALSTKKEHVVFMLWGAHAQSKRPLIDESRHLVLTAPHPSPLSAYRGFLGCRHFSHANTYLSHHNKQTIAW